MPEKPGVEEIEVIRRAIGVVFHNLDLHHQESSGQTLPWLFDPRGGLDMGAIGSPQVHWCSRKLVFHQKVVKPEIFSV